VSEQQLEQLRSRITEAQEAILSLPPEVREGRAEGVATVEAVLGYATVCMERTDPLLLSQSTFEGLDAVLIQVASQPAESLGREVSDRLLDGLSRLPFASGRYEEMAVREAATAFRRSASAQLRSLLNEIGQARTELANLNSEISQSRSEAIASLTADTNGLRADLTNLSQEIARNKQASDELAVTQNEAFINAQTDRESRFSGLIMKFSSELDEQLKSAMADANGVLSELQRMESETRKLVSLSAAHVTGDRYGKEAKEQRRAASFWRWAAIVIAACAVVVGGLAAFYVHPDTKTFIGKIVVSAFLFGIAGYAAKQSGHHRRREAAARKIELDLAAFGPFIEPLGPESKESERVRVSQNTFACPVSEPSSDEHTLGITASELADEIARRMKG
jgi:hypothetical protein